MNRDYLWILVLTALAAFPCAARTRVGFHPYAEWLNISPNGHWLYSGFGYESLIYDRNATPTRRHDLRTGRWRTAPTNQIPQWLANGQLAFSVATGKEESQLRAGIEGDVAPTVGLFWPTARRPSVVLRDKIFQGDAYYQTELSADGRTATVLSVRFLRHFDARTGRLKARIANPIVQQSDDESGRGVGALSPDGRFLLELLKPRIYNARTGKVRHAFPPNRGRVSDLEWITPTIFVLYRTETYKGDDRTYTEFYDAETCKRLWVLADFQRRDPNHNFWQSYPVIAQPNAIIVCGQNSWTWRDARSGRVLREAIAPTIWKFLDQNLYQIVVSGDNYFTIDKKGGIWRDKFRFTSRRK